ncbi:hypothetical protein GCM10022197_41740 [Microlunatus spumicola]|uniref:Uncharacterized protein n=1 Tax=Microlunatus spumicola TaxID=81499 RepID=A0ABP6YA09_9ACTN
MLVVLGFGMARSFRFAPPVAGGRYVGNSEQVCHSAGHPPKRRAGRSTAPLRRPYGLGEDAG